MNKLEKDIVTLLLIENFIKPQKISGLLQNFDKEKAKEILKSLKFMKDEDSATKALTEIAQESWNRIIKKTT